MQILLIEKNIQNTLPHKNVQKSMRSVVELCSVYYLRFANFFVQKLAYIVKM